MASSRGEIGEPLFPSLQRLEVALRLLDPCYLVIFSQSIRTLDFDAVNLGSSDPGDDVAALTSALLVSLCSAAPSPGDIPAIPPPRHLQPIGSLRGLRKLDVPTSYGRVPMDYPAMKVFSALANLRELSVEVHFNDMGSQAPCRGGFAALEIFRVGSAYLPDIEESLQMMASSRLRNLKVAIHRSVDAQQLTAFLDSLRRTAVGISSLSLKVDCSVRTETPIARVELLEPVLSLRHMQELTCSLRTYCDTEVSDHDIAALATAWPDLRVLNFLERGYAEKGVTVFALLDITRRCPRMESMSFGQLDCRHFPETHSIPYMAQSRVQHLEIKYLLGYMSPADFWILASLIDRIFPHLVIAPDTQGTSRLPPEVLKPLTTIRASRNGGSEMDRMF